MCPDIFCITHIILGIIWAITLPLYIILLIVLIKYRKTAFETSFFKIFISIGIADVCSMINIYAFVKAITWKFTNKFFLWHPKLIATTSVCWIWQSYYCQLNGVLLLNFNRYVAIVHPEKYEMVFTPRKTNVFIAIQWIVSIIAVAPRPFLTTSYKFESDNETLALDFNLSPNNMYYFMFAMLFCFFLCFCTIVMYAVMCVHVYLVGRQVTASISQNQRAEIRLFGVGLCVAIALFLFGLSALLMLFSNMDMAPLLSLLYNTTVDIFNEINPYSLIVLCTEVRVHLAKFLCRKEDTKVRTIKSTTRNKTTRAQNLRVAETEM